MNFWQNCEHIMVEYDITQEAFGRMIGVPAATVHRWKTGSIPRVHTIAKICDVFHVDRETLLSGDLNSPDSASQEGDRLVYYYMLLDDDDRAALMRVAETMAARR